MIPQVAVKLKLALKHILDVTFSGLGNLFETVRCMKFQLRIVNYIWFTLSYLFFRYTHTAA